MTAGTVVCWSMTSETQILKGSRVRRHGSFRRWTRYQARSLSLNLFFIGLAFFRLGRLGLPVLLFLGEILEKARIDAEEIRELRVLHDDLLFLRLLPADEK